MKIYHIIFLIALFITVSFPQAHGSKGVDTLHFNDSTRVILPDSAKADTAALFKPDTLFADTLIPLFPGPLGEQSSFISQKELHSTDYKNLSDILNLSPFTFINTTGQYGYPESVYLYGMLPNIMIDNVRANGTGFYTYDLNLVQTEMIDSVEVVKAPRGFMYSEGNEPAAINIIQKDFISKIPYTRIKYYEGPDGQALFDGMFSTRAFKKFNLLVDITNRKGDDTYQNSAYSNWQATTRLKYYLSDKINLAASYNYVKTESGNNNGVELDSVYSQSESLADFKDIVYDNVKANVISSVSTISTLQHNLKLGSTWKPSDKWKTNVDAYSLFSQSNLSKVIMDTAGFKSKYYYYGLAASQSYYGEGFDINLRANYYVTESSDRAVINDVIQNSEYTTRRSYLSLAPSITFYFADSSLVNSVFLKFTSVDDGTSDSFAGYGIDMSYKLDDFKFYLGGSMSDNYLSSKSTNTFEAGGTYSANNFNCGLNVFSVSDNTYRMGLTSGVTGAGIQLSYSLWKLLLENSSYYYFNHKADYLPDYKLNTGVYFKSILFSEHLDLKTGFVFSLLPGDYLKDIYTEPATSLFNSVNYKLDFTLAGIISKVATVYFTWENLTNNRYFIVPFHPMPERNIRFGLSWEMFN
jgi:hypothetical protein